MAKTFYQMIQEMLSSNLLTEVTDKILIILNALGEAMSSDKVSDYIGIFSGLAASIIICGFLMDMYCVF